MQTNATGDTAQLPAPGTSHDKVPYLDGWRGLAIMMVLAFHFLGAPFNYIGAFGVFMFFALSGLFMSQMLFIKKMDLPSFFVRRFSRVVPTFWLFSVCMFVYAATLQPAHYDTPPVEIFSTLFFLRTYLPTDIGIWDGKLPTGHFWSLNVEEHCYLFLAIGAFLFNQARRKGTTLAFLATSTAIVLGINIVWMIAPPHSASPWFVRTEVASIGLLTSASYRLFKEQSSFTVLKNLPSWLPIATFLVAAGLFTTNSMPLMMTSAFLLAFTVNHLEVTPELCKRLLSTQFMRWFGKCSFSIYLWQQPFYMLIDANPQYRYLLLALGLALGVSSFYCFENPIRLLINRAWDLHKRGVPHSTENTLPDTTGRNVA